MTPDQIKKMNSWLRDRIALDENAQDIKVTFNEPDAGDFSAAGFEEEAVRLTLRSDWWKDMVTDILETPDFAGPEESPEQVLQYARDVVVEYVAKRLKNTSI